MDSFRPCSTITIHLFNTYFWYRKQSFTFPFHHFYVCLSPIYASFGLGGSVFTQDIERGKRVADQIDTGTVFINHPPHMDTSELTVWWNEEFELR
ncbi:aldehyde dehydrogenase family protein [Flavobacterium sp.]|jgi:hypothetical protein|uniref:aldehyde dehydrogenase family protein n=1 Tax=Flavobacterium sp. TaxID=239 RepID=UPI002A7F9049|nr:aldehyde dehydrogenase family protein [Flavobacterium sp.]